MITEKKELKTVSLIIPVYNEEKYIEMVIESIIKQDYDMKLVEIIFVDGISSDKTISIIKNKLKDTVFNYKILSNPKRIQPSSVNLGINNAKNDIIIRLDAHSEYPLNYISKCVYYLNNTDADNVGCRCKPVSKNNIGKIISNVVSSKFGVGNSNFRVSSGNGYVDTVPFGTFRKELFDNIGLFNEELIRSEDNEFNYRIRKNGGKVFVFDDIEINYYPRDTIKGIMKMGYENGKWSIYTGYFIPSSMGLRHFIPFFFVVGLILGVFLNIFSIFPLVKYFWWVMFFYLVLDVIFTIKNIKKDGFIQILSFIIYPLFHISYGIGSFAGIWQIVKKKKEKSIKEKNITIFEYSPQLLRNLQLKSLEMFKYFEDFCKKNNLTVYFCGGCCIGTIRHKAFIPWDDDIDVFMPREDYEKLKELWDRKANTEKYSCIKPSEEYFTKNIFMTINDNNSTFIKIHQKDLDINHGIVIDIIPLDGCPNNKFQRNMQKIWALVYSLYCAQMVPKNHGKLVQMIGIIMLGIIPFKKLRWKIVRKAEKEMTKYKICDCDFITELCSGPRAMKYEYKKEWFNEAIYKEFEGQLMPIPIGFNEYLKTAFGDYMKMPPKEKQVPEHNVVYCDLNNSYKKYKGKYYCIM